MTSEGEKESSRSQREEALVAAPAEAGFHDLMRGPSGRYSSPELLRMRQEAASRVTSLMVDAGIDLGPIREVQRQYRTELDRLAQQNRHEAVEASAASRDVVQSALGARRKAIADVATTLPLEVQSERLPILLEKPFLILPSHSIVSGEQIAPFDSWVKTTFTRKKQGWESIGFYFSWENPRDHALSVAFTSSLGFNGHCLVEADNDLRNWLDASSSRLEVVSFLVFNKPGQYVVLDLQTVLMLSTASKSVLADTASASPVKTLDFSSRALPALYVVKPHELVLFEVQTYFHYDVQGDGEISVNFDDGSFAIACPFVAISPLSGGS